MASRKKQASPDDATVTAARLHDSIVESEHFLLKAIFFEVYVASENKKPFPEIASKFGNTNPFTHEQYRIVYDALERCHERGIDDPVLIGRQALENGLDPSQVAFDELLAPSPMGSNVEAMLRDILARRAREELLNTLMAAQSDIGSAYETGAIIQALKLKLNTFSQGNRVCADDATSFLALNIPEKRHIIAPYLREGDIAMIVARPGTGKTHFATTMAVSVASGVDAFGFMAVPSKRRVLYVDGEMSARDMQDRLRKICNGMGVTLEQGYFQLVTPDRQSGAMPNLATPEGQSAIDCLVSVADFVVIDNLSCLCRVEDENDAGSWTPILAWLLDLRRRGKCVVLLHHTNSQGGQRGTTKKLDNLDLVFFLEKPKNRFDCCFNVTFGKGRHLTPAQLKPFQLELYPDGDTFSWNRSELSNAELNKQQDDAMRIDALRLRQEDKSLRDIAAELSDMYGKKVTKDKVSDLLSKK